MTAPVATAPVAGAGDAPAGARRRRRPRPAALILLPVLALAGYPLAQANHEPLAQGSGVLSFGVADDAFRLTPQQRLENAFGIELRVVAPAPGTRVGIAFGLTNTGRSDVEILGVGELLPPCCGADPQDFTSAAPGGSGLPYVGLEPFTLRPGEARDVGVTVLVPGCPGGTTVRDAGTLVLSSVPVTWRWLGRTHVSQVELDFRASLEAAPLCGTS